MANHELIPGGGGLTHWQPGTPSAAADAFGDDIFLVNHHIAGTTHVDDPEALTESLQLKMSVQLVREQNAHDSFAVKVQTPAGLKLGYLPQSDNRIIARLLDAGLAVHGVITEYEMRGRWPYVRIDVLLTV